MNARSGLRRLPRLALGAALAAAAACAPAHAQQPPALSGEWQSAAIENYGSHHATRSFVFTEREWRIVYRAYADAAARQPLFRLDVGGYYALGQPSARVGGAHEGVFPALRRSVTAESEAGVQMFAAMGCTLAPGTPMPLVNQGCGFVPGVMQAMGEYDLVSLKDGQLFFGDREGDLTKQRPARLTPYALVRK